MIYLIKDYHPKYINNSYNTITKNLKNSNCLKKKWAENLKTFFQQKHTDGQQVHEKIFTSLIIREMQNKPTIRYNLTPIRMAITKK